MSELRTQLLAARRVHLAARYPSDLAAELPLHKLISMRRIIIQSGIVVAALAAVLLLAIRLLRMPVEIESPQELAEIEPSETFVLAYLPVITIPQQPEDFSLAVPIPDFAFPMPSFPSPFDYDLSDLMIRENL